MGIADSGILPGTGESPVVYSRTSSSLVHCRNNARFCPRHSIPRIGYREGASKSRIETIGRQAYCVPASPLFMYPGSGEEREGLRPCPVAHHCCSVLHVRDADVERSKSTLPLPLPAPTMRAVVCRARSLRALAQSHFFTFAYKGGADGRRLERVEIDGMSWRES
jgi:hypothetical protein